MSVNQSQHNPPPSPTLPFGPAASASNALSEFSIESPTNRVERRRSSNLATPVLTFTRQDSIGSSSSVKIQVPINSRRRVRSRSRWSPLEARRAQDIPQLPEVLTAASASFQEVAGDDPTIVPQELQDHFRSLSLLRMLEIHTGTSSGERVSKSLRVGVVSVSNAVAAAGTHNAILGLRAFFDRKELAGSRLLAIRSLSKGNEFEITDEGFAHYLNQAGSDLLPTVPLMKATHSIIGQVVRLCDNLFLDGLIFLSGPSELSEVAKISEHLAQVNSKTTVACILHSISGWVRLPGWINANLGFDSACGILAEVAGNLALSRQSLNRDIYHFVACGSKTLTLEVAMQIHPTMCFLGDDVAQRQLTLESIVEQIVDVIVARHHEHGLHAGVIMVSDDFFSQLYQMRLLREALHQLRREKPAECRSEDRARQMLPPDLGDFFVLLPFDARHMLVFRNGPDGLPLLPQLEAERELGILVARRLARRAEAGQLSVTHFEHHPHSLRHVALCPMPTPFDCTLGYALGHIAGLLIESKSNGYVPSVQNIGEVPYQWTACAVPMVRCLEWSDGRPAVKRRKMNSEDVVFNLWQTVRDRWKFAQSYRQPGPIQYWGPLSTNPLAAATYTAKAEVILEEAIRDEVDAASPYDSANKAFVVQLGNTQFRLPRRQLALLSPLQQWRMTYQPVLPEVLRGRYRLMEEHKKGRVCVDDIILRRTFPSLWSADQLKAVKIEPEPEEVNVVQMLPDKPKRLMRRDDSFAGSGYLTGPSPSACASSGDLAGQASPPSGKESPDFTPTPSQIANRKYGIDEFQLQQLHLRVGVVLIGRSGPGVNNVIQGLLDYLQVASGTVVCFALGLAGLVNGLAFEVTEELLAPHRNQGGCDLLGQSQPEDIAQMGDNLSAIAATVRKFNLDGLVVWGGRNVHSWTAHLAEYFAEQKVPTRVIGVPASVQSDLPLIEQTLGYDTVCKLFSAIVGNLAAQVASSGRVWCFVRIPGRSISHIAAEVALETHPHVVLMSADTGNEKLGLSEVTEMICNVIEERSKEDNNYGLVLIPDQLLASVCEMKELFEEVAQIHIGCPEALQGLSEGAHRDFSAMMGLLPPLSRALFQTFPERVRAQICGVITEFAHGKARGEPFCVRKSGLDLASVETEVIFQALVEAELTRRVVLGSYKGPFQAITYSLPYHGRSAMPTNFDCDLGYTIGYAAGIFVAEERSGVLVDVSKLKEDVKHWEVGGTPLSYLLHFQEGTDPPKSEIRPRSRLLYDLSYEKSMPEPCDRTLRSPGPAQFAGPCSSLKTQTLCTPQVQRVRQTARTEQLISELKQKAAGNCPPEVLRAVKMLLQGGVELLKQF